MGGKVWSDEEERVFWLEIVPASNQQHLYTRPHDGETRGWEQLRQVMQTRMGAKARRQYSGLMLYEHFFQNSVLEHFSPNAGPYVRKYIANERATTGMTPNERSHSVQRCSRRRTSLSPSLPPPPLDDDTVAVPSACTPDAAPVSPGLFVSPVLGPVSGHVTDMRMPVPQHQNLLPSAAYPFYGACSGPPLAVDLASGFGGQVDATLSGSEPPIQQWEQEQQLQMQMQQQHHQQQQPFLQQTHPQQQHQQQQQHQEPLLQPFDNPSLALPFGLVFQPDNVNTHAVWDTNAYAPPAAVAWPPVSGASQPAEMSPSSSFVPDHW